MGLCFVKGLFGRSRHVCNKNRQDLVNSSDTLHLQIRVSTSNFISNFHWKKCNSEKNAADSFVGNENTVHYKNVCVWFMWCLC